MRKLCANKKTMNHWKLNVIKLFSTSAKHPNTVNGITYTTMPLLLQWFIITLITCHTEWQLAPSTQHISSWSSQCHTHSWTNDYGHNLQPSSHGPTELPVQGTPGVCDRHRNLFKWIPHCGKTWEIRSFFSSYYLLTHPHNNGIPP